MALKHRESVIMDYLYKKKTATVGELCRDLYISEPTVRRALCALSSLGLIIRTHGGALYKGDPGANLPLAFREREHSEAKATIAKRCLSLIKDGDTIMLDGSSSALALLREIKDKRNVCVITNSAKAALILEDAKIKTYVSGGELAEGSFCYVGSFAERFIRSFSADACFFSVRTLTRDGKLTDNAIAENLVRRAMLENSTKHYLMLDSYKVGEPCLGTLCTLDEIDRVISEEDISFAFPNHAHLFI